MGVLLDPNVRIESPFGQIFHMLAAPKHYFHSLPVTLIVLSIGAIMSFALRELLFRRDDVVMSAGLAVFLGVAISFPQFAGNQEVYTARSNYTAAITVLRQAVSVSRVCGCGPLLFSAVSARRAMAAGTTEELRDPQTDSIVDIVPYVYKNEYDREIENYARKDPNALQLLLLLAQFDAICTTSAPEFLLRPTEDMYVLTFAFLVPLSVFPVMGWWYLAISFYPTLIAFGGFRNSIHANRVLDPINKEYSALIDTILGEIKM